MQLHIVNIQQGRAQTVRFSQLNVGVRTACGRLPTPQHRVFCDVRAYVSSREYVGTPQSAQFFAANQGGTTGQFIRP